MARRFGSLTPLRDTDADSESDAAAKVIQALVGGAAYLFELIAGHAVSNDSQVTPPNPQGDIGIDMSGPPWGSAIKHPIAWCGGAKPDAALALGMTSVIKAVPNIRAVIGPWLIWVRPFESLPSPSIAPYARGEISVRGHSANALTSSLFFDVRNLTISTAPMPYAGLRSANPAASVAEESLNAVEGTMLVALVPGWNIIEIGFWHAAGFDYFIDSIVINQIQKRTHA